MSGVRRSSRGRLDRRQWRPPYFHNIQRVGNGRVKRRAVLCFDAPGLGRLGCGASPEPDQGNVPCTHWSGKALGVPSSRSGRDCHRDSLNPSGPDIAALLSNGQQSDARAYQEDGGGNVNYVRHSHMLLRYPKHCLGHCLEHCLEHWIPTHNEFASMSTRISSAA